ncbi:MAG: hypothetical protein E6G60_20665 [Actinobacteria bacterium]|nr:MAG: hypothetical protein E6G60_20665 [Actinomycetota bacterium]
MRVPQAVVCLPTYNERENLEPMLRALGDGLGALLAVVSVLREHPAAVEVSEAGSARRRKETFRDLDIIATATDAGALIEYFTKLAWVIEVVAKGPSKATVLSNEGLRFDLRVVPPESYGNLLQHFTGSKDHNVALRERAVKDGLSVSEYSITVVETGEELSYGSEAEVYERLGYQFIPPELRENAGELETARKGELPTLVELADIKGELHSHSTWSDGKNTLEQMALAARERGCLYMAITDHPRGTLAAQDVEVERAPEAVRDPEGDRGEHPRGRIALSSGRRACGARLGDRVDPRRVRPQSHGARASRDGQCARRLHRPPDGAQDQHPSTRGHRRRAHRREGRRDRHVPRDQLPAEPARRS